MIAQPAPYARLFANSKINSLVNCLFIATDQNRWILNAAVIGCLNRLFCALPQDGRIPGWWTAVHVAEAAGWEDDPATFLGALRQAGVIDAARKVTGWEQATGYDNVIHLRQGARERKRRERGRQLMSRVTLENREQLQAVGKMSRVTFQIPEQNPDVIEMSRVTPPPPDPVDIQEKPKKLAAEAAPKAQKNEIRIYTSYTSTSSSKREDRTAVHATSPQTLVQNQPLTDSKLPLTASFPSLSHQVDLSRLIEGLGWCSLPGKWRDQLAPLFPFSSEQVKAAVERTQEIATSSQCSGLFASILIGNKRNGGRKPPQRIESQRYGNSRQSVPAQNRPPAYRLWEPEERVDECAAEENKAQVQALMRTLFQAAS